MLTYDEGQRRIACLRAGVAMNGSGRRLLYHEMGGEREKTVVPRLWWCVLVYMLRVSDLGWAEANRTSRDAWAELILGVWLVKSLARSS